MSPYPFPTKIALTPQVSPNIHTYVCMYVFMHECMRPHIYSAKVFVHFKLLQVSNYVFVLPFQLMKLSIFCHFSILFQKFVAGSLNERGRYETNYENLCANSLVTSQKLSQIKYFNS